MVANPLLDLTKRGVGDQFSFASNGENSRPSLDLMRVTQRDKGDAATGVARGNVDKSSMMVGWSPSVGSGRTMTSAKGGVLCWAGRNVPIPWVRPSGEGNLDTLRVPLSTVLSADITASHETDTDPAVLNNTLPPELASEVSAVIGQASEALRGLDGPSCLPTGLWLEVSHNVSCLAKTSCCGLAGLGVIASEERFDAGFGVGDREWAPVLDVGAATVAPRTAHGGVHDVRCGRCDCRDAEPIAVCDCLLSGVRINGPGSAARWACGPSSVLAALLADAGPGNSKTEVAAIGRIGRGELGCEGDFTPCR